MGCATDSITKITCDFFKVEEVVEAKKVLWALAMSTRSTDRQKVSDNVIDIVRAFDLCDEKKVSLPRFVIFEPDQVPIVPGETTATLTRKLNEFYMEFKSFAEQQSVKTVPHHSASMIVPEKPTYAVVVKNPPKNLDNPSARKDYLDSLAGSSSSSIVTLRPRKDEWRVFMSDKAEATALAEAITNSNQGVDAKVKSRSHFGIIRRTHPGTSTDDIQSCLQNCTEVSQIRSSRSFRLKFETREHLQKAIDSPPKIGYERLPVSEYKFLPPQCYRCQAFGHTAANCVNSEKCSQCAGSHKNSKDSPCQRALKCALCGKTDHPCYAYKCPVAQKLLK